MKCMNCFPPVRLRVRYAPANMHEEKAVRVFLALFSDGGIRGTAMSVCGAHLIYFQTGSVVRWGLSIVTRLG